MLIYMTKRGESGMGELGQMTYIEGLNKIICHSLKKWR